MAVDININGANYFNASTYSVSEDATPIDPSDTSAAVSQFTVTLPVSDDFFRANRGQPLTLTDGSQGSTTGKIIGVAGDRLAGNHKASRTTQGSKKAFGLITYTVDSRMAMLNVTRTAQPYSGTLGGAFTYYLGLVGITDYISIDSSIANRSVVFPGWSGVVWDNVKALCSAQQVEASLVGQTIVLRPLRTRTAVNYRDSQESFTIQNQNVAQSVEVYYYQSQQLTGALCYPLGGWHTGIQAYQVDAGATVTFDISLEPQASGKTLAEQTLGVSLSNITQPTCVASVAADYQASSVYTVSGNDGLPITPAQWNATGGSVTAKINPDTRSITVTITGSNITEYSPYTIGMASNTNTYYSSLRLLGDGVFYNRGKATIWTGNTADEAPTVIGATVDNPYITTIGDAYAAGRWAAAAWTGPLSTISVTTTGINRKGDVTDLTAMYMGDFNIDPDFAGLTMAQFNTKFAGLTMAEFTAQQAAKVSGEFAFQAFGNVAGARVFMDGSWFRITQVTGITESDVTYTATADNTMADFNTAYAGMTMAQFNAAFPSNTNGDFNAIPFPNEEDAL